MEQQYASPVEGVEVERDDFDLVSKNAAWADDRVLSELFRMLPVQSPIARGIIAASSYSGGPMSAVVTSRATADARVIINPFRAVLGYSADVTTALEQYKNIRSVVFAASGSGNLFATLQLAAATNNRWDLIYARVDVDVDDAAVNRYVKDTSDNVASQSLSITKSTTITVSVVQGTEATNPTQPAVPADSGSAYYIPLAYVLLPAGFSLTTSVPDMNILEVAPILSIHRATGAASLRIATACFKPSGAIITNEGWTPSSGRPRGYMPATMGGKEEIVFALHLDNTAPPVSIPLDSTGVVLDDSTDWRSRIWKCFATAANAVRSAKMPWEDSGSAWVPLGPNGQAPNVTALFYNNMAQSFHATASVTKAVLMHLTPSGTTEMATGSDLLIYVDVNSGKLMCDVGATDPQCQFIFWLEATGQHNNCF